MRQHLDPSLVSLKAPASFAAEQYQGLRMTVEQLKRLRDVRLIAVTSPSAGDGKTLTSINLAGVLARGSDARVLLIDADLRRPEIATRLGIGAADSRKLLGEALTHLDPSKVLGLVFNRDTQPLFGYYNSSYYGYFDASAGAA